MTIEKFQQLKTQYININQKIQELMARKKVAIEDKNNILKKYKVSETKQLEEIFIKKQSKIEKLAQEIETFNENSSKKLLELEKYLIV